MAVKINFPMRLARPIIGADISAYNAQRNASPIVHFDFDKFIAKGGQFLFIRSSVANSGEDYEWEYNVDKAIEKKIPFGLYHYGKMWKDIPKQAEIFSNCVRQVKNEPMFLGNFKPELGKGIRLDIEANDGLDKNTFTGNAEKLVRKLVESVNMAPGIYTSAYFWDRNTYRNDWAKYLPLWVANWFPGINPLRATTARPILPDDWGMKPALPDFWQFDVVENGAEWGSTGDDQIDLNWFVGNGGTYEAFEGLYGIKLTPVEQPPVVIPPTPVPTEYVTVTVDKTNIRSAPVVAAANDFGDLHMNKKIHVVKDLGEWLQVDGYVWKKNTKPA